MLVYYALPQRQRWKFLLLASYVFYGFSQIKYLALLLISTIVDFVAGQKIAETEDQQYRKYWLWASIAANLSILFVFKYFNFFVENVNELLQLCGMSYAAPMAHFLLPVGISFFTFQSMSYTFDVYQQKITPEKNFGRFALYVSFFPQLVAGPIERAGRLLPQFRKNLNFEYDRFVIGGRKIVWGLFKKMVIADNIGQIVNLCYASPEEFGGGLLLLASYLFAFQIYCDFSGYTDIAIGSAKILGIDLMENFRLPYFSKSIPEFWKRWHISLSTWFRDYVYFPLGGNRVGQRRWVFNILVVFLVSGFWHGANWTFLTWGGIHGFLYLAYMKIDKVILPKWLSVAATFQWVVFAWIFFRASNFREALFICRKIVLNFMSFSGFSAIRTNISLGLFVVSLILLAVFLITEPFIEKIHRGELRPSLIMSRLIYGTVVVCILLFGYFGAVDFIYFRF